VLQQEPTVGPLTLDALRAFMHRSETPMVLTDDELRYREVNEAACRLSGRSREELLEMHIGDLVPSDDQDALPERVDAFFRDGTQTGQVQVIGAGDELVEVEFSSIANVVPGMHLSLIVPVRGDTDLIPNPGGDHGASKAGEPLTPREREILSALALGRTGAEIATELVISPETVRNHVRNARAKLGARTRAQAIARALQRGEIRP
jgi:DNA-binding CsgD family transcriptional regulator